MDLLGGLRIAIDTFWYNILLSLAGLHWSLLRGFIMMGYTIELINNWLVDNAFVPLIQQTNASLNVAISLAFVVALLVLGITYLLAAFVRLEVVSPRSALMWYLAGALFFSLGPALYRGMNDFRTTVAEAFYLSTLQGLQGSTAGAFNSLNQVQSSDLGIGPLCDNLGVYLPGATFGAGVDGLDVALAYLRADGPDVMGYPQPVASLGCPFHPYNPQTGAYVSPIPQEWYFEGSYFDNATSPFNFENMDDRARAASIDMAASSQGRMLTAWPLVLFGVVEQLVYLLITIAQGITFLSFGMAILFAFFKKTEVIARSIVDQWIELVVQTVIIALVQSLVVAFFLAGTTSGSGMVVLGIGLICLIFMLIVLWSGVKAVWNSFNRLFNAMGQAAGRTIVAPGTAAALVATSGATMTGVGISVGSNALAGVSAFQSGATLAQTAGLALGGIGQLTGAARTLAYLPGVRGTSLGDAAEQFTEGAITRQVARHVPLVGRVTGPLVGTTLLTNRDPEAAEYDERGRVVSRPMLVPAVGDALESWSVPRGKQQRTRTAANDTEFIETEDGELLPLFTPIRARRMGTFTPVSPQPESDHPRSDYAAEMQGEEMEQHISDVMRASTGSSSTLGALLERDGQKDGSRLEQAAAKLESGAEALAAAARMLMLTGHLKVSGAGDVAGVMGDLIRQTHNERATQGQPVTSGIDNLALAEKLAQAMGVTPLNDGKPSVQENLSRFGLFANQSLRMGIAGDQAEQVIREVKSSPAGRLSEETRATLIDQLQTERGFSWEGAHNEVVSLERSARMLPDDITAFGKVAVPQVHVAPEVTVTPEIQVNITSTPDSSYEDTMKRQSSLGGSDILGGTS